MIHIRHITFTILTAILIGCESPHDYLINIYRPQISVTGGHVALSVESKKDRRFHGKIRFQEKVIHEFEIQSELDPISNVVIFDIDEIEDEVASAAAGNTGIPLSISFTSQTSKLKIDTLVLFQIMQPPIVSSVRINQPQAVRGHYTLFKSRDAAIKSIIRSNGSIVAVPSLKTLPSVYRDTTQFINVSVSVDTALDRAFIARWPNARNKKFKSHAEFQQVLQHLTSDEELPNNIVRRDQNRTVIERRLKLRYSGLIDTYLVISSPQHQFIAIKLFEVIVDDVGPEFNRFPSSAHFNGDPRFEGKVYLDSKEFFGYPPYRVPFTGIVYGDVHSLLIEGTPVNFKVGEEFYLKRSLYLDGGYNRVNITIVDKRGNRTKAFIPITMERMENNSVTIDNNIDIDNY